MTKKRCSNCKEEKPLSQFARRKGDKCQSWCRACAYTAQQKRWYDRKIKAVQLLGEKCQKCGYNRNYAALAFHHLDPKMKKMSWSKLKYLPWKQIIKELKKCILLCRNCHAETHFPNNILKDGDKILDDNNLLNKKMITSTGVCPICEDEVYGTIFCSVKCVQKGRRKVKRPSKKVLERELAETNYCAVGRKYSVSDNAVRKWAKAYGLM